MSEQGQRRYRNAAKNQEQGNNFGQYQYRNYDQYQRIQQEQNSGQFQNRNYGRYQGRQQEQNFGLRQNTGQPLPTETPLNLHIILERMLQNQDEMSTRMERIERNRISRREYR